MEIGQVDSLMMGGRVMPPEDVKLALALVIVDPIEMHVNGFQAFLFDGVIYYAAGHVIVHLHGVAGWTWPNSSKAVQRCFEH